VVLPQSLADIFAAREHAADVANVGEDLRPKRENTESAYASHIVHIGIVTDQTK
jgi:hypothetical protein